MPQRLALLIGSGSYDQSELKPLSTPSRDVSALAGLLRNPQLGGFDEVQELVDEPEARVRRVMSAFFRRKNREDLLLVYFSGHGLRDERGRLHLAARDTDPDDLSATAVPASFVSEHMDLSPSRRQVLVLDCCFSGAFVEGGKGGGRILTQDTFEGNGYGRVVITASDSTQFAREGDPAFERARLSLFTHFLIEGLSSGAAAKPGAKVITLNDWYEYAYGRVVTESSAQTPCKWVYNQKGELVIARNPSPTPPPQKKIPDEVLESLQDPRRWVRLGAVQEIGDLLRSDATYTDAASDALQPLTRDDSIRVREAVLFALSGEKPASATSKAAAPSPVPAATEHQTSPRRDVDRAVESAAGSARPSAREMVNSAKRTPLVKLLSVFIAAIGKRGGTRIFAKAMVAAVTGGTIAMLSTLATLQPTAGATPELITFSLAGLATLVYGCMVRPTQPLWGKLAIWSAAYCCSCISVSAGVHLDGRFQVSGPSPVYPLDWWFLISGISAIAFLQLLRVFVRFPGRPLLVVIAIVAATPVSLLTMNVRLHPGAVGYITMIVYGFNLLQVPWNVALGCGVGIGLCEYYRRITV